LGGKGCRALTKNDSIGFLGHRKRSENEEKTNGEKEKGWIEGREVTRQGETGDSLQGIGKKGSRGGRERKRKDKKRRERMRE
jgi:hypothetical protein